METLSIKNTRLVPMLLSSFILIIGMFISASLYANTTNQASGIQLAYYVGYHHYPYWGYSPGYIYYGPRYHRYYNTYWTHWRYIGHGCRKSCLVNKWNGHVIRCKKRCSW